MSDIKIMTEISNNGKFLRNGIIQIPIDSY